MAKLYWPGRVLIREVGPRDGLQNEKKSLPVGDKVNLIKSLARAGVEAIEATSFVHPGAVPQLSDAEEVIEQVSDLEGVSLSALVGNTKGVQRALETPVKELVVVISASDSHNRANLKMSTGYALENLREISELAREGEIRLRGAVGTSFGCPYQGDVTPEEVEKVAKGMRDCGIGEITLADAAGQGDPREVYDKIVYLKGALPGVTWALHFHDTRGLGLANAVAAIQAGGALLESSIGGTGGCPFIPGAAGNIATEDLVYMLHRMGIYTGIDLDMLCRASSRLETQLERSLPVRISHINYRDC